jgi:ribosomal protein S24E
METINIIEEKKNDLFKRKEIVAEVRSSKIPSRDELLDIVAKKFSAEKQVVVVERIKGKFGSSSFRFFAKVYASEKDKEKVERKSKKNKKSEVSAQTV